MSKIVNATSIADLYKQIGELPQKKGEHVQYKEIYASQEYEVGDEAFAEKVVALKISQELNKLYDGNQNVVIVWRIPPEHDIHRRQILAYREDGPFKDPISDRQCFTLENWRTLKFYMRLALISLLVAIFLPQVTHAQERGSTFEEIQTIKDFIQERQGTEIGIGGLRLFPVLEILAEGVLENHRRLLRLEEAQRKLEEENVAITLVEDSRKSHAHDRAGARHRPGVLHLPQVRCRPRQVVLVVRHQQLLRAGGRHADPVRGAR